jgi:methionyl-tRNA formyltransferase
VINTIKPSTRVVFFGSSGFSLPSLVALRAANFEIAAIVTQPDRPTGRGKNVLPNVIKKWATEKEILVLQPTKAMDADLLKQIKIISPDIFVVAAYGMILPKPLLEIPKFGAINVHASLLPKYRGASPVQAAILSGDEKTGVSIMLMDEGMDTGPVINKQELKIEPTDTAEILSDKLAKLGSQLLVDTLPDWLLGKIKTVPQDQAGCSNCKKINKKDGKINWQETAVKIERMIRAYHPWPSAWTVMEDQENRIKIIHSTILDAPANEKSCGEIFILPTKQIAVCCGKNTVLILDAIQPPNKKVMPAYDFFLGHKELLSQKFI